MRRFGIEVIGKILYDYGLRVCMPVPVESEKMNLPLSSILPSRGFTEFSKEFRINLIA